MITNLNIIKELTGNTNTYTKKPNSMARIVYSGLKTPDGTIIQSIHRHDYKTHIDKNGKEYMIDGGTDYVRRSVNGDEELITLYDIDDIVKLRQFVTWGRNYDKDMNRLPKTEWVILANITDDHLDALCLYNNAPEHYRKLFIREKQFRNYVSEIF